MASCRPNAAPGVRQREFNAAKLSGMRWPGGMEQGGLATAGWDVQRG